MDIRVAVEDSPSSTTRLWMTRQRPGRKWTEKSWTGSRSVWTSPSPSDLILRPQGCTWVVRVVTSAVEDVVVAEDIAEDEEEDTVTPDPATETDTEVETDTEMIDETGTDTMKTEIEVTDITTIEIGMRGEMTEIDTMTGGEDPVMEDIQRTGGMTPILLLLALDTARDLGQDLQAPMREIQDQEENTDLEAENMKEDIKNDIEDDFGHPAWHFNNI